MGLREKEQSGSFAQKKKELTEYEELESSGFFKKSLIIRDSKIKQEYLED